MKGVLCELIQRLWHCQSRWGFRARRPVVERPECQPKVSFRV